jgi:hypothetical protein
MSSLFEEADATADAMHKRPGFSEADLQLMFRRLQKRWHPTYTDNQVRDLFELWQDHYRSIRAAEKRAARERIPLLLCECALLLDQMRSMPAEEQVAAGARLQTIAQEIAVMYARATGREGPPPPADAASWA